MSKSTSPSGESLGRLQFQRRKKIHGGAEWEEQAKGTEWWVRRRDAGHEEREREGGEVSSGYVRGLAELTWRYLGPRAFRRRRARGAFRESGAFGTGRSRGLSLLSWNLRVRATAMCLTCAGRKVQGGWVRRILASTGRCCTAIAFSEAGFDQRKAGTSSTRRSRFR